MAKVTSSLDENGVKSAVRVARILSVFEDEKRPLTINVLVKLLGYPQSSISNLMQTLHAMGLFDYIADQRAYIPSLQLALLGQWVLESHVPLARLGPVLQELADETNETVILGALRGPCVQYLHVINSVQAVRFHLRTGLSRPALWTALGLLLISDHSDEDIGRMVRRNNAEACGTDRRVDLSEVMKKVAFIRDHGYFQSHDLATRGAGVVAVRLPAPHWMQSMAVGIGAPNARLVENGRWYIDLLRRKILRAQHDPSAG